MDNAKAKKVFSDKKFVEELLKLDTPKEVKDALTKKGLDVSEAEIKALRTALAKSEKGEMSDDELDSVAGGVKVGGIINFFVPRPVINPMSKKW